MLKILTKTVITNQYIQSSMSKEVFLPDGSKLEVEDNDTVEDAAYRIGQGIGDDCVAAYLDGELVGSSHKVESESELSIITKDSESYIEVLRHTAAHVFAQALKRLHPEAKLTIGPPIEDGFYYDIANIQIDSEVLDDIESEMDDIIQEDLHIHREEVSRDKALEYYSDNPYKRDILEKEADGQTVSFYRQGDFKDLCRGGHLDSTGQIGATKLLEVSTAYWRGDEDNDMLTRVYGTAFETEEELDEYIKKQETMRERSHRKIGNQMNLFQLPDFTPAPQYLPKGMKIRRELEEYMREINDNLGYEEVWTPELNTNNLFRKSGHYDAFGENDEMFHWEQGERQYGLKPMNCANHSKLYNDMVDSYRDLPVKLSEFGTVYRYERSGSGSGLFRARGFTQDDGHAFVRPDQIHSEVKDVLNQIKSVFQTFELKTKYKLETRPDNSVGSDENWEKSTAALERALNSLDIEYLTKKGEGAFYGPKIGVDVEDVFGREWTLGTVQIDFNIPQRLNLTYTDDKNQDLEPVMIHRAIIGSFERFIAILLEDRNGHLPIWLSPIRARVLPISEDVSDYAYDVKQTLEDNIGRIDIDDGDDTVGRKIRRAHKNRIPYSIVVGQDEKENNTLSVRDYNENKIRNVDIEDFTQYVESEIESRNSEANFIENRDF